MLGRRSALHATALMRPLMVVMMQGDIQGLLHLLNRLIPFLPTFDPKMLAKQGPVQPFDKAVALGPADLGRTMVDALQL